MPLRSAGTGYTTTVLGSGGRWTVVRPGGGGIEARGFGSLERGFAGLGALPGGGWTAGFSLIPAPISVELGAFDTSRDLIYQSSGSVTDVSVAFGTGYWGAVYREKHRYAVYADPDRYTRIQRWDVGTGSWVLEYTGSVLGNVNREDSTRPTASWPALACNGGGAVTTPPRWVAVYAGADQQVVIIEAKGSVTSDGPVLGFREFEIPPSVKRGKISQPVVAVGQTGGVYVAWAEDPDGDGSGRVVIRWLYSGDPFSWDAADVEAVDDPGGDCTLPSLAISGTGVVMLVWRFEDDDGARFIHGIVGSEDPDVVWGLYALTTASVWELTTSGSDRDPCVWANAAGRFWCAWINYDPGGDWAAVQVVTTSNGLDGFAGAAPVYVTEPVLNAFANFPNGAATDTHAVLTWEVGRATGERTDRRIGMAALETTDPDRWSTPDLNVLGFPDGEDVQGQYPSVSVYDWGAATFVQLFWMRGQSSDTTADYYEPASLHLIEGTVVQAERVIHGAPTR